MSQDLDLYYKTALQLKLPVFYKPELGYLQLSLGKTYLFMPYLTPFNNSASIYLARDRQAQNKLLSNAFFPVPKAIVIYRRYFNRSAVCYLIRDLQFPLLVRPRMDHVGKNEVIANIQDEEGLLRCLESSFKRHRSLQIMEFYQGRREYHILMLKNRILSVMERRGSTDQIRFVAQQKLSLENKERLIKAAQIMNLEFVGFKILCDDPGEPFTDSNWVLLDASFCPNISLHESAYPVAKAILKQFIFRHPLAYFFSRLKTSLTNNKSYG